MRKKLLFIITKSEMGGAQKFLYELITHLNPENYEITVAAGGNGKLLKILANKNIKIQKIKYFSNFFSIKNFLAFIEIFNIIRKTQPDIIYLLSSEAGFSGSIAGSLYHFFSKKKPKIIYRIGGWAFKEPRNIIIKKIYLWAEKLSAPFKDIIITNSEFDRKLALKNNIAKPNKVVIIYNGLNINGLEFLAKEEARRVLFKKINSSKESVIGTIANLYQNKGIDILIRAAARIKSAENNWNFIIIGEGKEREKLENLIKKFELQNSVFLTGAIPDAYQYLKAFDIFVLPSIKEGQPWVILEAMAAEVPIVATNIAGIPEMIESEKSGLLVEPADFESLALAIEKIITHPSLAKEFVENAFAAVKEKFNLENMIRKNEELF